MKAYIENYSPLVSVIVPIYKVEKYLQECVESIIRQTYKNLEIILVDDGSPDKSGDIADSYAEMDSRVRVIHKENGGLSDARNVGIESAKGDYISLIDSDDYISEYFIEIMMKNAIKFVSDIVTIGGGASFWDKSGERPQLAASADDYEAREISIHEALEEMLYQNIANGAPFRLYKKEIFENIKYPKGYLFEDVATTYKTFIAAKKMCFVDAKIYAYRVRSNSIVRQTFTKDKLVAIPITRQLYKDICEYDPSLMFAAASRAFAQNFHVFLQVPKSDKESMKALWDELLKYRKIVASDKSNKIRKKNKLGAYTTYLGMGPSYLLGNRFGKSNLMKKPA